MYAMPPRAAQLHLPPKCEYERVRAQKLIDRNAAGRPATTTSNPKSIQLPPRLAAGSNISAPLAQPRTPLAHPASSSRVMVLMAPLFIAARRCPARSRRVAKCSHIRDPAGPRQWG